MIMAWMMSDVPTALALSLATGAKSLNDGIFDVNSQLSSSKIGLVPRVFVVLQNG